MQLPVMSGSQGQECPGSRMPVGLEQRTQKTPSAAQQGDEDTPSQREERKMRVMQLATWSKARTAATSQSAVWFASSPSKKACSNSARRSSSSASSVVCSEVDSVGVSARAGNQKD